MLMVDCYIAPSPYGLGLFAGQRIKKGCMVYRETSDFLTIISATRWRQFPSIVQRSLLKYVYDGGGRFRLTDGSVYFCTDDSRFMNHSETPSLAYVPGDESYIAAHDIDAGQELTCDYCDFCTPGMWCFDFVAKPRQVMQPMAVVAGRRLTRQS